MKIAVVPSNQHLNSYAGISGATEEKWAVAVCGWLQKRLKERGAEVGYFHVPGAGEASTDELASMLDKALAWKPDYVVSVHSDAVGDVKQTGILMLMARPEDAEKGQQLGRAIAEKVGLPYKASWVYGQGACKILYLRKLREHRLDGSLVEVGEHATTAEARWNWEHAKEIGVGIADALAVYLGLDAPVEEEKDMTPDQDKMLRGLRVSDVARSYDIEILKAMITGDNARVPELEADKAVAVKAEKKRLGLIE